MRSPAKKMFRFQSGDAASPTAGAPLESPYAASPVGREAPLGSPLASPKRAQRKIARSPFKARLPALSCACRRSALDRMDVVRHAAAVACMHFLT
jgi:hypothetical protein